MKLFLMWPFCIVLNFVRLRQILKLDVEKKSQQKNIEMRMKNKKKKMQITKHNKSLWGCSEMMVIRHYSLKDFPAQLY